MRPRSRKPDASTAVLMDDLFALVMSLPERRPAPSLPRRLDGLFDELRAPKLRRPADDIEELIWAVWIAHEDVEASTDMATAIEAISLDASDLARPILDRIVERHPDWAEAWNKRATLAFIDRRDDESLADIARTLTLEPRHFGAVAGFAQLCLRRRMFREARAAFQMALAINPHLQGLDAIIAELADADQTLH